MTLAKALAAAAGNAGEALYVDDVMSTYLYTGNGSTQTITNGIDLAGEGGMVWSKCRSFGYSSAVIDTVRGVYNLLVTNSTAQQNSNTGSITSFSANGYSIGTYTPINDNTRTYASWTFRKAPKFFDVVTYTGNGVARTIAHNLGSVPGCIITKRIDNVSDWAVYHRMLNGGVNPADYYLILNDTNAQSTSAWFGNTTPTASVFSVGADGATNQSGATYVAYLFAHDAGGFGADGSENVISCGGFTTASDSTATVNLGYEPQWVMCKRTDSTGGWYMFDNMRGWPVSPSGSTLAQSLRANTSAAETTDWAYPTSTGFFVGLQASASFIYIAIRRPMKPPTVGTEVFSPRNQSYGGPATINFPLDMQITRYPGQADNWRWASRLVGISTTNTTNFYSLTLSSNSTDAETTAAGVVNSYVRNTGYDAPGAYASGSAVLTFSFRRAPGFFDVVCYTGDGTVGRAIPHNLTVAPEMMILKGRNTNSSWLVAHEAYNGGSLWWDYFQVLNGVNAVAGPVSVYTQAPTSTNFYVDSASNTANGSGTNTIAYLFATYPGVSKVFSYTGNGSSQTINCGFTGGARFVMIKRTDSTGDWYVWDTARGMVAGDDPHLSLNTTAYEVTTDDSVDTAASGFIVNQLAATNVNVTSATYIGLAIA